MKKQCRCGSEMIVSESKKSVYCPDCDRPKKLTLDSSLSEMGKELISLAAGMNQVIIECDNIFTHNLDSENKRCELCLELFPVKQLADGKWCTECLDLKKETN